MGQKGKSLAAEKRPDVSTELTVWCRRFWRTESKRFFFEERNEKLLFPEACVADTPCFSWPRLR